MATYYRLRSVEHLLGEFQELERQQIYFASPKELNDPSEGFTSIVWRGDAIAWRNFFTHYVRCFHTVCLSALASSADRVPSADIPVLDPLASHLSAEAKAEVRYIVSTVFDRLNLEELIEVRLMAQYTIRFDEVAFWLERIHSVALIAIRIAYTDQTDDDASDQFRELASSLDVRHVISEMRGTASADLETAWRATIRHSVGQDLLRKRRLGPPRDGRDDYSRFLIFGFTRRYLEQLPRLLHPDWYVACFMRTFESSAAWGHYGDGHRGVCLIFETRRNQRDEHTLVLKPPATAKTGRNRAAAPVTFHPVRYEDVRPMTEFFSSISQLPTEIPLEQWHTDHDGNLSSCANRLTAKIAPDEEPAGGYERFYRYVTSKGKDWQYECESRLIAFDDCGLLRASANRQFQYSFRSLQGVIFGIATSDQAKIRIIDIVRRKCLENRHADFRFYQAYQCDTTGRIDKYELALTGLYD